ncbi:cAMP-responsive element modulator [Portunus trituberculatus]|uniref:cAMP-responsive element modulator n=1 Tax=Portunus trituberculatus TaxID=210409 RepID=A0A5B7JXD0_PORTR|nr:cAMP-responsive element modulator [Portunus trituberculatus]
MEGVFLGCAEGVKTGDLSGLKIATSSSQGVVLATTASTGVHGSSDQMAEEASRKREIRLMKNRQPPLNEGSYNEISLQ